MSTFQLHKHNFFQQCNNHLHWLPVCQRINFKVATLVHWALLGNLPLYLA